MIISENKDWLAPSHQVLPDFIIGGAMKCGTTTLHEILAKHPDVFIPNGEIHFFDIDNILQHGDFNFYDKEHDTWYYQDFAKNTTHFWNWYSSFFKNKNNSTYIGEDSTTYLASPSAARRIALQQKPIKMIFMLRQPTERAYSQYIHLLRTGRAMFSFEDTLRHEPQSLLQRSMYLEQLRFYYEILGQERIKVVIMEEFLENKQAVMFEICEFLNIDFKKLPEDCFKVHANKAKVPKYPSLQVLRNRLFRNFGSNLYSKHLPNIPSGVKYNKRLIYKVIIPFLDRLHDKVNKKIVSQPPKMSPTSKQMLDNFFRNELDGLNELIGKNVLSKWFPTL